MSAATPEKLMTEPTSTGARDVEQRRRLIRAKLLDGMNRVPLEDYDFSTDHPSEDELNLAATDYAAGRCSLDVVREKFRTFVEVHRVKTTLFE